MKIGVISDTHIPIRADALPNKVVEALRKMDMILHAGDLVELSVLTTLNSICANVKIVCGNMDPLEVRSCLPQKEVFTVGNYRIGLTHGSGSPVSIIERVSDIFKNDKIDIIVFGHSHSPVNEKRKGILYFNPGSPTDTICSPFNSFGIIEINDEIKARIVRI